MSDYNFVVKIADVAAAAAADVVRLEYVDRVREITLEGDGVTYLNGTRGFLVNSNRTTGAGDILRLEITVPNWAVTSAQAAELYSDLYLGKDDIYVFNCQASVRKAYLGYIKSLPDDWGSGMMRDAESNALIVIEVIESGTYAAWDGHDNLITWVDTDTTEWTVGDLESDNSGELGFTS